MIKKKAASRIRLLKNDRYMTDIVNINKFVSLLYSYISNGYNRL